MTTPDLPARARAQALIAGLGITRAEAAALLLLALAAVSGLLLLWWLQRPASQLAPGPVDDITGAPQEPAGAPSGGLAIDADPVVVHVAGLVAEPGLQRLPGGARVADALVAAGGPLPEAWLEGINLARPLSDGEQLLVPAAPDPADPGAPGAAGDAAGEGGTGMLPDGTIDLNLATIAELETLPGVGPVTAQRIVEHREEQGPFRSVGQLRDVSGIGEKTFQRLAELVVVR